MDKLEAIKSELREMEKVCELNYTCNGCTYQNKCNEKLGLHRPKQFLKVIERCEKLLND